MIIDFLDIYRSEASPTNADELKWLKTDMNQLKDELTHTRNDISDRLVSMEIDVSVLRYRMEHMDEQIDEMTKRITSVSLINFILLFSSITLDFYPVYIVTRMDYESYGTCQNG